MEQPRKEVAYEAID